MTDNPQFSTVDRARPVWEKAFLRSLARLGNVTRACLAAKIDRTTAYKHRDGDEEFARLWQEAIDDAADMLEAEARRRAERGVLKDVYYKGDVVGQVREYSDTLMALLLKANKPEKFRDRQEITGKDGGPIEIQPIDYRTAIAPLAPGPMDDSDTSSQD